MIHWDSLAKVVVIGVLAGAGIPALFAVGVRAFAGPGSRDGTGQLVRWRAAIGTLCFATVVGAVAIGVWIITGH